MSGMSEKPDIDSRYLKQRQVFERDERAMETLLNTYHTRDVSVRYIVLEKSETVTMKQSGWGVMYVPRQSHLLVCLEGHSPMRIEAGGCACLPSGTAHTISTGAPGAGIKDSCTIYSCRDLQKLAGNPADYAERMAGKTVVFQIMVPNIANPVPDVMPPAFHISREDVSSTPGFASLIRLMEELGAGDDLANELIRCRIADAIAVKIVVHVLSRSGSRMVDSLEAGFDPNIRKVLKAVHEDPAHNWSVDSLADKAHLSRASFAKRFKQAVGDSPMGYITRVRINLACSYLQSLHWPVAAIAREVGYTSEAAFIKAFRREMNTSPGKYRRRTREE